MTEAPKGNGSTVLDSALARVNELDPSLAATLTREVSALRDGRRFGLVFEKHLPESVRLPDHPVKRGVKVALRAPKKGEEGLTWRVQTVSGRGDERAALLADNEGEECERVVQDLVVVRDFGEPVYPGLRSVERIERGGDAPWHTVINGENCHVLQALRMTHRKAVDLIYIDPPYNTGTKDWIYNDRHVDPADRFIHSKWLSFMERRLTLAKDLLKDTGIIICAIGDDEHHRLRMLMDQVFGAQNFIMNATWQGGGSSLSRFHAGGVDYMLIYAREMSALTDANVRWKVEKEGLQDILAAGADAWEKSGHDSGEASRLISSWWRKNKSKYDPGLGEHVKIDTDGTVVVTSDLSNSLYRPNLRYKVTDPATGTVYDPPDNGWAVKEDVMDELIRNNSVIFGERPRRKAPLAEMSMRSVMATFNRSRNAASKHLTNVLGTKDFPYPKNVDVIARWIKIATTGSPEAVVLDFFGGTGTTTEAVMRLNAEERGTCTHDESCACGNRQSILVTNNEVSAKDVKALTKTGVVPGDPEWEAKGVFEFVTRARVSTVVTGRRPDGSTYSDGLDANVEFFDLTYLDESRVQRAKEFEAVAPLLWLWAGGAGDQIGKEPPGGWALTERYGVLNDIDAAEDFLTAIVDRAKHDEAPRTVFIVTDSTAEFATTTSRLPGQVRAHQLYESYLRNFEINTGADL